MSIYNKVHALITILVKMFLQELVNLGQKVEISEELSNLY